MNAFSLLRVKTVHTRPLSRRRMSSTSSSEKKPYVYQVQAFPPVLQSLIEEYFRIVTPDELEKYREEISAIFVHVKPQIQGDLIRSLPRLKVVGNCAVGYNNIDLQACKENGVRVGYTPDVLNDTTADMAMALLLAVGRRVVEGDEISKSPQTTKFDPCWYGSQVSGTTIGIVGMGRIGLEVAKRAHGFNMKVLYNNRSRRPAEVEELVQATYIPSLLGLLGQSDYVVLVAPATKETYKMIGRVEFAAMKKTGIFVNVSRGSLVDQDALVEALQSGKIAGAGLDVTDPEPLPRDHPLLTCPNITITPHTGSATLHTRRKMVQLTIDNMLAALKGEAMPAELDL